MENEADTLEIGPGNPEPELIIGNLTRDVRQLQREMRQVLSILSRQSATAVTRQPVSSIRTPEARPAPQAPILKHSLRGRLDWETIVGRNWLARIGVIAILIGTAFFLILATQNCQ